MKIALLANLKENAPSSCIGGDDKWDDLDSPKTIHDILDALASGGHQAEFMEASIAAPHNLIDRLERFQPELCFNIAEGHFGDSREAHIPALLEMMRVPYTGSHVLTLALALDKPMTKRLLHYHALPTPEFQVFGRADEEINDDLIDGERLRFPLFVKPSKEGTGMGVSAKSIVRSVDELRDRLADMLRLYNQPILCERFIEGRELTVGIVGNLKPTAARRLNDRTAPTVLPDELIIFPSMEINTEKYDAEEAGLYTNKVKTDLVDTFYYTCPAQIEPELEELLFRYASAVFQVTGCHDVARIDFRIEKDRVEAVRPGKAPLGVRPAGESFGVRPSILEINPLPGLNPKYSDLCIEAYAHGWSYEQLILSIADCAAVRYGLL